MASILKLPGDLRAAIAALAAGKDLADLGIQALIIQLPLARLSLNPSLISAARHLKDSAHLLHTKFRAVLAHEPEYRCGSSEKMATAFFKMSRSRRSRSFSRLSCRNSSSAGFKWPLPGKACLGSWLNCRFHRLKTPWPIPNRRSTSLAVTPGSAAIRTASNLNSQSYVRGIDTPPVCS